MLSQSGTVPGEYIICKLFGTFVFNWANLISRSQATYDKPGPCSANWVAGIVCGDTVVNMRRLFAAGAFSGGFGIIALAFFFAGPVVAVFAGASLLALLLVGLLATVAVPALFSLRSSDPTIDSYRIKHTEEASTTS